MGSAATVEDVLSSSQAEADSTAAESERGTVERDVDIVNVRPIFLLRKWCFF